MKLSSVFVAVLACTACVVASAADRELLEQHWPLGGHSKDGKTITGAEGAKLNADAVFDIDLPIIKTLAARYQTSTEQVVGRLEQELGDFANWFTDCVEGKTAWNDKDAQGCPFNLDKSVVGRAWFEEKGDLKITIGWYHFPVKTPNGYVIWRMTDAMEHAMTCAVLE